MMQSQLPTQPTLRLSGGWMLLALVALALSTLCALLLVLARLPWSGTPTGLSELFGRALVLHVSQAVVVWFLACAAALWTLASGAAASPARWAALALCASGLAAMVLTLFLPDAQPVLANYVPVLNHPLFFAGLTLFVAGLTLCGALACPQVLRRVRGGAVWHLGALLSIGVAGVALLALLVALLQVDAQEASARFELLAWGPGHLLQFVHMLLLMSVWTLLGEQVLGGQAIAPRRWLQGLLLLAAAPVLGVLFIYFNYALDSAEFRHAFTLLMAWGIWPAATVLALRLVLQIRRAGRMAWQSPLAAPLLLSILLFLLGCGLGALIRSDTTLVPAHYHGTVGAVTLAYMALGYHRLRAYTGPLQWGGALQRWQPLVYGCGLVLLALGLAWSGWLGAPRKSTHLQTMLANPGYFVAMGLAGLGGLLAIGGAGLFVFNIARSVWRVHAPVHLPVHVPVQRPIHTAAPLARQRGDVRLRALGLTLALVGVLGVLLATVSADSQGVRVAVPQATAGSEQDHARKMRLAEVDRRFSSGVVLLSGRNFDLAANEFHRVLELAPKMPEAHVNMGFALLGTQRYAVAKDFFTTAIDINTSQLNAYYGLALALEGLHDLAGARGAMRSYIHLARADDPYLTRANAALWEWDGEMKLAQQTQGGTQGGKLR